MQICFLGKVYLRPCVTEKNARLPLTELNLKTVSTRAFGCFRLFPLLISLSSALVTPAQKLRREARQVLVEVSLVILDLIGFVHLIIPPLS